MTEHDRDKMILAAGAAGLLFTAGASLIGRRNRYRFAGKNVLITGGSRGLGLVLARQFAREGAIVSICARDRAELDRAAADLQREGVRVMTFVCDVTSQPQVEEMVSSVLEQARRIDVLVNNAGTIQVGPLETMTLRDFREAMNVHFWGPLYTTLAVLPHMKIRRTGRIANISSIGGKISVPHLVPYSASKFALVGLSKGLRSELKRFGITVTTVCPGLMRTGSPRNAKFKGQHEAEYAWFTIADSNPLASIGAERAARQIVDAIRDGDSELIISTQAKLAAKMDALFPEFTSGLLEYTSALLPEASENDKRSYKGYESTGRTPSALSALSDRAAVDNNEMLSR